MIESVEMVMVKAMVTVCRILSTLKHPQIVAYHESFFDEQEEHLCIIQVRSSANELKGD